MAEKKEGAGSTNRAANRRVQMTKRMLREALADLMETQPIGKITVRQLCACADVNRSTFYSYYSDLYQLLYEMEKEVLDEMPEVVTASAQELVPVLSRFFAYLERNRRVLCVLLKNAVGDDFRKRALHTLLGGGAEVVDIGDKWQLALIVFVSGCFTLTEKWIFGEIRCTPEQLAETVAAFAVKEES